ncbi:MAG: PilN domain-containing protein [Chitinivibrionia bacterium]|nr:PilN domain-containing protein [Chitinivibrionia bacterium]
MIRINLLPLEDRKASRSLKLPSLSGVNFVWPVVIAGVFAAMVFAVWTLQSRKTAELELKIAKAKEESAQLAPQLEKIRKLTKEREEVNKRLNIIASLDRDRYLRVKMLNDISEELPANCWLTSVQETGGSKVSLDGITFSNYIIADFMNNLERTAQPGIVALVLAQEGKIMEYSVIKFSLEYSLQRIAAESPLTGKASNES